MNSWIKTTWLKRNFNLSIFWLWCLFYNLCEVNVRDVKWHALSWPCGCCLDQVALKKKMWKKKVKCEKVSCDRLLEFFYFGFLLFSAKWFESIKWRSTRPTLQIFKYLMLPQSSGEPELSRAHCLASTLSLQRRQSAKRDLRFDRRGSNEDAWVFLGLRECSGIVRSTSPWLDTLTHACLFLRLSGWYGRRMISFDSSYCANPKQRLKCRRECACLSVHVRVWGEAGVKWNPDVSRNAKEH